MRQILLLVSSFSLALVEAEKTVAAAGQDAYAKQQYAGAGGQVLPYRLLKPAKIESGREYPLVLFLHGAGERGADNALQPRAWGGGVRHAGDAAETPLFCRLPPMPARPALGRGGLEPAFPHHAHEAFRAAEAGLRVARQAGGRLAGRQAAHLRYGAFHGRFRHVGTPSPVGPSISRPPFPSAAAAIRPKRRSSSACPSGPSTVTRTPSYGPAARAT